MADNAPTLHELPDGSLVAYFDIDGEMIDDESLAVSARILKPDGTMIFAAKNRKEET